MNLSEVERRCTQQHEEKQRDARLAHPTAAVEQGLAQPARDCSEGREETLEGCYCSAPSSAGLLLLSDEVLLLVLRMLDPFSLLRAGCTCTVLWRVCSTASLWRKHCMDYFTLPFTGCENYTPQEAFRLLYMWHRLYRTLPYNRQMQDLFFSGAPPSKYWMQWLVLEEMVPLPSIQLPAQEIQDVWGLSEEFLEEKHKVMDETSIECTFKYEWREMYTLTMKYYSSFSDLQRHVLSKLTTESHEELDWLFGQYNRFRFQWLFTYWLFGLSKSCAKQLQRIFLWWKRFNKQKVSSWGKKDCNVQYLASLHHITSDFWNGRLAKGDENLGIQTVENYFSMCKSLSVWILGRNWGRLKQKKVYEDTLEGVYRSLKLELQLSVVDHAQFWQLAKVQMTRVCKLEETAANYVNWRLIDSLPSYRLYMMSGNQTYLDQIRGFLMRKRLVNNWLLKEENAWVRCLLPEDLLLLLEYDTKLCEGQLHGDTLSAHLSRIIWIYLHSNQQLYMEAMKGFVFECAHASYMSQIYESGSITL
ncbi:hypothetical protein NDU88_005018 [Pleurodeles waltl]|uniref:F-box domain-containing protein n=1 Tax=Pleurodeles waltl TaxID=8319 RepID=A0AAV7RHB0_PLEWA|nr:hypothetical protein NDU88_005018 [Pleurodeles waltl]